MESLIEKGFFKVYFGMKVVKNMYSTNNAVGNYDQISYISSLF